MTVLFPTRLSQANMDKLFKFFLSTEFCGNHEALLKEILTAPHLHVLLVVQMPLAGQQHHYKAPATNRSILRLQSFVPQDVLV